MRALRSAALLIAAGCSCGQEFGLTNNFGSFVAPEPDEEPSNMGTWSSFDLSPDGGRLTMAYYDRSAEGVGYAIGTIDAEGAVTWAHERVDGYGEGDPDVGMYAAQRTAADGSVWVAYHDADANTLRARKRVGGGVWEEATEVAPGGMWASMVMDGSRPIVAHADAAGALYLSTLDDGEWSTEVIYRSAPTDWTGADGVVETRPALVAQPRLLIDGDELLVAVHDAAKGELHLLGGDVDAADQSDFDDEVIASGDVGAWPSMVVHKGRLSIAYQDVAEQDLVVATREGNGWTIEVVDDGQMVGADSEIFSGDDALGVVYFDGWNGDAKLATADGGGWTTERIAGATTASGFHNETRAVGDRRFVGTYDYTSHSFALVTVE
jgi:hypothetical protein